jgi:glycosyltransferase involved in cell wall biosynthesis
MARLIQAFNRISPDVPHRLALLGHPPSEPQAQAELASAARGGRVVATGYVPDEHVLPLLSNADLLAFPSWYEGFGLPVLDAQALGIPIACSTAASLPEVAGQGAVYFDPYSVDEMAAVIRDCLQRPGLRTALAAQGTLNAERYSWNRTARLTLDVYQAVASRGGR